mmetsp:Transcript_52902/g.123630  ORF Transcript_52902/g.123630 Transcript_52902/m.123630 type:complete len:224 (-) Transcript_52902:513-1184(-)
MLATDTTTRIRPIFGTRKSDTCSSFLDVASSVVFFLLSSDPRLSPLTNSWAMPTLSVAGSSSLLASRTSSQKHKSSLRSRDASWISKAILSRFRRIVIPTPSFLCAFFSATSSFCSSRRWCFTGSLEVFSDAKDMIPHKRSTSSAAAGIIVVPATSSLRFLPALSQPLLLHPTWIHSSAVAPPLALPPRRNFTMMPRIPLLVVQTFTQKPRAQKPRVRSPLSN